MSTILPIVDSIVQRIIVEKISQLKKHPKLIDLIFQSSNRAHKNKIFQYLNATKIKVIFGYPREPAQLPCIAICHATEQEIPMGLGENALQCICRDLGISENADCWVEDAEEVISQYIDGTCMQSTTRIGLWADNADFIMYFSQIIKWCLLSSRLRLFEFNWVKPKINTQDLRLETQFSPQPVYAKDIMFMMQHDNWYITDFDKLEILMDIIEHPKKYKEVTPPKLLLNYSTLTLNDDNSHPYSPSAMRSATITTYEYYKDNQPQQRIIEEPGMGEDEIDYQEEDFEIPTNHPIFSQPKGQHKTSIDELIAGRLPPLSEPTAITLGGKKDNEDTDDLSSDKEEEYEDNVPETDLTEYKVKVTTNKINIYSKDIPEYFKNINPLHAKDIVNKETGEIVIPHQEQWVYSLMASICDINSKREKQIEVAEEELSYISEHEIEL